MSKKMFSLWIEEKTLEKLEKLAKKQDRSVAFLRELFKDMGEGLKEGIEMEQKKTCRNCFWVDFIEDFILQLESSYIDRDNKIQEFSDKFYQLQIDRTDEIESRGRILNDLFHEGIVND
jgi:hypothetical protein